jgi:hypothetical protein
VFSAWVRAHDLLGAVPGRVFVLQKSSPSSAQKPGQSGGRVGWLGSEATNRYIPSAWGMRRRFVKMAKGQPWGRRNRSTKGKKKRANQNEEVAARKKTHTRFFLGYSTGAKGFIFTFFFWTGIWLSATKDELVHKRVREGSGQGMLKDDGFSFPRQRQHRYPRR